MIAPERAAPQGPPETTAAWLSVAVGIAIIAAPLATGDRGAPLWGNLFAGILVVGLSASTLRGVKKHDVRARFIAGANVALGLLLIVLPFLARASRALTWADIVLGVTLATLAALDAWALSSEAATRSKARPGGLA